MRVIEVSVMIDRLDDETVSFVGSDTVTVERQSMFGQSAEVTGRFPTLWLDRDGWMDMGCPTLLTLRISEVTVDDRPAV